MARKRMIDPEFWRDEKVAQLKPIERLLFIGLWNFADDDGYGRANPTLIKADVFPYDTLRAPDIEKGLASIATLKMITLYEVDGQQYYHVLNFKKHQSINKPQKSTLPKPGESLRDDYGNVTGTLPPKRKEEKRIEENINIGDLNALFESVWLAYPNKKGKGQVSDTQKKKLYAIGEIEILRCISRYLDGLKADDWRKPQYGSTFFNSGYVDYLDENYAEESADQPKKKKYRIEIINGQEVAIPDE